MTTIYFIRHAESDYSVRESRVRPLTEKGLADCSLVTEFLSDKNIDVVLSSPYKRAVDTLLDFTDMYNFDIQTIEDFCELKSDNGYRAVDFSVYMKSLWTDFNYRLGDGESLGECQRRNIAALEEVLTQYRNKNIVIGTHGIALSAIINYYDSTFGYEDFMAMSFIFPWVVKIDFNDDGCICIEKIDLFNPVTTLDHNKCKPCITDLGKLKAYKFTVIFSRYKDKWLYCRAKSRDTFETAGGHIEEGESPLDSAKRELYEETGAAKFDITPVFDYSIHYPNICTTGQVFLAHIHELGDMPNFEMTEVKLFDTIPDKMRFPKILPVLFEKINSYDLIIPKARKRATN